MYVVRNLMVMLLLLLLREHRRPGIPEGFLMLGGGGGQRGGEARRGLRLDEDILWISALRHSEALFPCMMSRRRGEIEG